MYLNTRAIKSMPVSGSQTSENDHIRLQCSVVTGQKRRQQFRTDKTALL
jgi:hypothetical protein